MLTLAEKRWFLSGSKKLMMLLKANQKKVCNFKTTKNGSKIKKEDTAPSNNFFDLLPEENAFYFFFSFKAKAGFPKQEGI